MTEWLAALGSHPLRVEQFDELKQVIAPVSDGYLRKLLRDSGHPLDPLVAGVRQENFDMLAESLTALEALYSSGDPNLKQRCRALVLEAKQHSGFALRKADNPEKREMMEWMRLWLENPGVFPVWVNLRRQLRPPSSH